MSSPSEIDDMHVETKDQTADAAFYPPVKVDEPERKLERFWPKFWRNVGKIPFSEDLAAAWYCYRDPKTPARVKGVLAGALAYFVIPTDALPDMIVGLGFTDDATVLAMTVGMVSAHIKDIHRAAARALLKKPDPRTEPIEL